MNFPANKWLQCRPTLKSAFEKFKQMVENEERLVIAEKKKPI